MKVPIPLDRAALRQSWSVDDGTPVVVLLGGPVASADTWAAAHAASLVRTASGRALRLLIHPQQRRRVRTQDHLDRGPDADLLIQDARLAHPLDVLPGCDAALFVGSTSGPVGNLVVVAGMPAVAPDTPAHRTTFAHTTAPTGFAPGGEPKKLADRLLHIALQLPGLGNQFAPPRVPGMSQIS